MALRSGRVRAGLVTAALMMVASSPVWADDPAPARKPEAAPASVVPTSVPTAIRRVPRHFGKVGLSVQQREEIYKIQAAHQEKILTLRHQLEQEQARSMAEAEAVLTDAQKKALEEYRQAATAKKPVTTANQATSR